MRLLIVLLISILTASCGEIGIKIETIDSPELEALVIGVSDGGISFDGEPIDPMELTELLDSNSDVSVCIDAMQSANNDLVIEVLQIARQANIMDVAIANPDNSADCAKAI